MLSKTRLNIGIHVMNNSNEIFPGNISYYVTLLHSRKYYIFIEIMSVMFSYSFTGKVHSMFKVVLSFLLRRRDVCAFKTLSSSFYCFFHDYRFLDFVMSSRHCFSLAFIQSAQCVQFQCHFVVLISIRFDGRPPLALYTVQIVHPTVC